MLSTQPEPPAPPVPHHTGKRGGGRGANQ